MLLVVALLLPLKEKAKFEVTTLRAYMLTERPICQLEHFYDVRAELLFIQSFKPDDEFQKNRYLIKTKQKRHILSYRHFDQ